MKAITELRHHEPSMVVPLLKRNMYDKELLIRSFVAMGLGAKRNDEGFEALLNIIGHEDDPNVVAEAANSLANFGPQALPHLTALFEQNSHWLIRQSILPVLDYPESFEALVQLCRLGYQDQDLTVKLAAIANLERLKDTAQAPEALDILLQAATDSDAFIRAKVARLLMYFDAPQAQAALAELRQDSDYRVVKVFLEALLP
ncbi:pbs lyase heat domain protein repeat-containing protein [Leptolyngbya sp. Heron Island J]|nr:pbs lyase heat domain protein repeat-containing protein [Leptolyngbya sp. Heron Island J]